VFGHSNIVATVTVSDMRQVEMDNTISQFNLMNDIIRRQYKIYNFSFMKPHYILEQQRGRGKRKMKNDWRLTNEISYSVDGLFRKSPYYDWYCKESDGEAALWKVSKRYRHQWGDHLLRMERAIYNNPKGNRDFRREELKWSNFCISEFS
jgi:hypothetical protein